MTDTGSIRVLLGLPPISGDEVIVDCRRCGRTRRYGDRPGWHERLCINRCCVEWRCPSCGDHHGGYGPVGCRCELGGPNPLPLDGRAYRQRIKRR